MPLRTDRLKQRRQYKGLSQADLAGQLTTNQQQINRWESGTNDPSADVVARMARTLDCTTDWLLGLVEQPHAHLPARDLSATEHQLLELYRQRKLPEMISRLVNELARADTQERLEVNGDD